MLPVPDWVYTQIPIQDIKTMTFNVTPVFFNVGINEQATVAGKLGLTAPQEKNNGDNFRILTDYLRRYKKIQQASSQQGSIRGRRIWIIGITAWSLQTILARKSGIVN